jgi:hypothetical protein
LNRRWCLSDDVSAPMTVVRTTESESVELQSANGDRAREQHYNRAKHQKFHCGIASSPGEWHHELPRIRERFQSPDSRQCGIYTCIRQRLRRIAGAVMELSLELSIG